MDGAAKQLFGAALLVRVIILFYGEWQDRTMVVKFTDIDYAVYTDAAHIAWYGDSTRPECADPPASLPPPTASGDAVVSESWLTPIRRWGDCHSPYRRATYRYTPLLAWLMIPAVVWHSAVGKCMFVACDLAVGVAILALLRMRQPAAAACSTATASALNRAAHKAVEQHSADDDTGAGAAAAAAVVPQQAIVRRRNSHPPPAAADDTPLPTCGDATPKLDSSDAGHGVSALVCVGVWLFNPLSLTVSTRGNADCVVLLMVVGVLWLLLTRRVTAAAVLYGLCVHFKIYPIIHAPAFLFFFDSKYDSFRFRALTTDNAIAPRSGRSRWEQLVDWCNVTRIQFTLISAGTFIALFIVCFIIYGEPFWYETYYYHLIRRDHRHNFSLWFYTVSLNVLQPVPVLQTVLSFAPQCALLVLIAYRFSGDIGFACFLQTYVFVAFNKVITAQYFVWYQGLFPLVLPASELLLSGAPTDASSPPASLTGHVRRWLVRWRSILGLIGLWFASEFHWLGWAYHLEFKGWNNFLGIWMACALFFAVNVYIICVVIRTQRFVPVFRWRNHVSTHDPAAGLELTRYPFLLPDTAARAQPNDDA